MKHSEIIRESKKYLWNGKERLSYSKHELYVCHCIARFEDESLTKQSDQNKVTQILKRIQKKLGYIELYNLELKIPRAVEDWVETQGFNVKGVAHKWKQDYRSRWMDAMIKEYEEAGK